MCVNVTAQCYFCWKQKWQTLALDTGSYVSYLWSKGTMTLPSPVEFLFIYLLKLKFWIV